MASFWFLCVGLSLFSGPLTFSDGVSTQEGKKLVALRPSFAANVASSWDAVVDRVAFTSFRRLKPSGLENMGSLRQSFVAWEALYAYFLTPTLIGLASLALIIGNVASYITPTRGRYLGWGIAGLLFAGLCLIAGAITSGFLGLYGLSLLVPGFALLPFSIASIVFVSRKSGPHLTVEPTILRGESASGLAFGVRVGW